MKNGSNVIIKFYCTEHTNTPLFTRESNLIKKNKKNKKTCISCRTHSTYVVLVKDQLLPFFTQITLSSMLSSTSLYILHCFKCYYNSEQTSPSYLFAHNKKKIFQSMVCSLTIIIKSLCKVVGFF